MRPLVLPLPGNAPFAARLALELGAELDLAGVVRATADTRILRLHRTVTRRDVVFVASITQEDEIFLPLLLLARQARAEAAASLVLVAPHLPELDEAQTFVATLTKRFDAVVTVRGGEAPEGSRPPWRVATAWPAIAAALGPQSGRSLLVAVGDGLPWMEEVAQALGSRLVRLANLPLATTDDVSRSTSPRIVLLAERVATGEAIAQAAAHAGTLGWDRPLAIVVHAEPGISIAGVDLWTSNTRLDATNRIDVSAAVADAIHHVWGLSPAARFSRVDNRLPSRPRLPVALPAAG